MPTYSFRDQNTGDVFEKFMSISAREQYLKDNPQLEVVVGTPLIVRGLDQKPDSGFRDVLKEIRRKHDKRFTRSTINTF